MQQDVTFKYASLRLQRLSRQPPLPSEDIDTVLQPREWLGADVPHIGSVDYANFRRTIPPQPVRTSTYELGLASATWRYYFFGNFAHFCDFYDQFSE